MFGKVYLRAPSLYSNQMLYLSSRTMAWVPRNVPTNSESSIRKLKNKKIKFGRITRFFDTFDVHDRPPPAGIYRGGLIETDFTGLDDKVKQAYSLNNSSLREMQSARLKAFRHRFGNGAYDTGSSAMQAAALCEKTLSAIRHLQENYKDSKAAVNLQKSLVRRRRALIYLKCNDFQKYAELMHYYKVKDVVSGLHKKHFHLGYVHRNGDPNKK